MPTDTSEIPAPLSLIDIVGNRIAPRPAWEMTLGRINHYVEHPIVDERMQLLETPIIRELMDRVIGTELPIPENDKIIPIRLCGALQNLKDTVEFGPSRVAIDEAMTWLRQTYGF